MYIVYNIHVMFYIIMFNRYPIVQETTEKHRKHSPYERKPSPKQPVASGKVSFQMGNVSFHFEECFLCFTFQCLMRNLVSLYNLKRQPHQACMPHEHAGEPSKNRLNSRVLSRLLHYLINLHQ